MKKPNDFREPSSWLVQELHLVLGFLSFSEFTSSYVDLLDEEEVGSLMSYNPPQPVPVRSLEVVPEQDDESEPSVVVDRHHRIAQDPPEGKGGDDLPCRSVASGHEFCGGEDSDSVQAVSPPSKVLRPMQWADEELSCATGRIVFIEKP